MASEPGRWTSRLQEKQRRVAAAAELFNGRQIPQQLLLQALEALICSGDRVALEGNNQKQADFLARTLQSLIRPSCTTSTCSSPP